MSLVVLITGASSGLGAALAQAYAQKGNRLVLTARRLDRLTQVARTCMALNPSCQVLPIQADVTHPHELERVVAQTKSVWQRLDVVVANAGFGVAGLVEQLSPEDYRRQFETNVFGVLHTLYATLAELKKTQGRLAIMGSVYSYVSHGYVSAYCMSKHAVKSLAESLYLELKPYGISVTLICPGIVESEIRRVDNLGHFHSETKDPTPTWLQYSAQKAALQILRAIEKRKREQVITGHGKALCFLHRHFPSMAIYLAQKGMGMLKKRHQEKTNTSILKDQPGS